MSEGWILNVISLVEALVNPSAERWHGRVKPIGKTQAVGTSTGLWLQVGRSVQNQNAHHHTISKSTSRTIFEVLLWKEKLDSGAILWVRVVAIQTLTFALGEVARRKILAASMTGHATLSFLRCLEYRNESSRQVGVEQSGSHRRHIASQPPATLRTLWSSGGNPRSLAPICDRNMAQWRIGDTLRKHFVRLIFANQEFMVGCIIVAGFAGERGYRILSHQFADNFPGQRFFRHQVDGGCSTDQRSTGGPPPGYTARSKP